MSILDPKPPTRAELTATYASQYTITPATTTADLNTWLAAPSATGIKRLVGSHAATTMLLIPSNTYLDLGDAKITRQHSNGGNGGATFINSDQVNGNTNITVVGGTVDVADGYAGKHFTFVKVDGIRVLNNTITKAAGDFMGLFKDCTNVIVNGLRWSGSTGHGEDGLHLYGGSGYVVSNCHISSGDDAISLTVENATNTWLERVEVTNCVLSSVFASAIKINMASPSTVGVRNVHISNISINQPVLAGGHAAIRLLDSSSGDDMIYDVTLSGISINMNGGLGVGVSIGGIDRCTLENIEVRNANGVPFYIGGGNLATTPKILDLAMRNCRSLDQVAANSPTIKIDNAVGVQVVGCRSKGATAHAIQLGQDGAVSDALIQGNYVTGSTQSGIRLVNVSGSRTIGNRLTGCATPITESGTSTGNLVAENDVTGCTSTAITVAGSSTTRVFRNLGHRTENGGKATIAAGQTNVTVSHALAGTPSRVTLTPNVATPEPVSATAGAGSIVIYRVGTTGTLDVFWDAAL